MVKLKPDEQKQVRDARLNQRGHASISKSSYGKLSRENESQKIKMVGLMSRKGGEK